MTTPTATSTDPALRERIAAALTGIGEEAGSVIARVAEEYGAELRAERATDDEVGRACETAVCVRGRVLIGRPLTTAEGAALEVCIRAHLEAEAPAPAHPTPTEMAHDAWPAIYMMTARHAYEAGITAERSRLADLVLASARLDTAKAILDAKGDTMEAMRLSGEARALRELAEGLR